MEDPSVSNKGLQINDLSEKLSNLLTATQNTTLALFSPQAIFPETKYDLVSLHRLQSG